MSSGIIGMQRLHWFVLACVTMWESFYVIRDYWNAVFAFVFTSIRNDVGVIVCHPGLLECSVCIGF